MNAVLTTRARAEATAERLRVLAQPTRLRILSLLLAGERSVGEIEAALDLKQPGLSQQLAELRQAGLVSTRRQGKVVFYKLAGEQDELLLVVLERLLGGGPTSAVTLARPRGEFVSRHPGGEAAVFGVAGPKDGRSSVRLTQP
jgi:DNA-binding transcriptional ArsR family regulator